MRSPYDVLGLGPSATPAEIKSAYRALALRLHPDRPGGDETRFVEVAQAYRAVTGPTPRPRAAAPTARPAPAVVDLSHVGATAEDLDARWHDLLASMGTQGVQRRRRRGWWR